MRKWEHQVASPPMWHPSFFETAYVFENNHYSWTPAGQQPSFSSWDGLFSSKLKTVSHNEGNFPGWIIDYSVHYHKKMLRDPSTTWGENAWLSLEWACLRSCILAATVPQILLMSTPLTWPGTTKYCWSTSITCCALYLPENMKAGLWAMPMDL